ncbi:MAG: hypothetical protein F6K22_24810 [Okeania sp. SIO2F4]|uniref:hypothetical protein n=1 Tax=Okeania sp. SIO2F4 TaxID=2607790 RepID=UPI001428F293|nr:hypothetical protein [Okeania sp. SIO2F4]NES05747.1 hypothetical protein [Okeania sp. SIO2F4]
MQRPYYFPHFPTQSGIAFFLRNGIIEEVVGIIVRVIFLPLSAQNPNFLVVQAKKVELFFDP